MLGLRSLHISGTVFNNHASSNGFKFLSHSLCGALSSARIVLAGVEVSSYDHLARTEHVLSLLQSDDARRADVEAGSA